MKKLTQGPYPGILCGIIILILTGLPGSCFKHNIAQKIEGLDKVIHFCMFTAFALMSLWGYRKTLHKYDNIKLAKTALIMIIIGISYGCLTELMQHFLIKGRTGSTFDALADTLGTIVGTTIYIIIQKTSEKKIIE